MPVTKTYWTCCLTFLINKWTWNIVLKHCCKDWLTGLSCYLHNVPTHSITFHNYWNLRLWHPNPSMCAHTIRKVYAASMAKTTLGPFDRLKVTRPFIDQWYQYISSIWQHLRSASVHHPTVPCYQLSTFGRQAFSVTDPMVWNLLQSLWPRPQQRSFQTTVENKLIKMLSLSTYTAQQRCFKTLCYINWWLFWVQPFLTEVLNQLDTAAKVSYINYTFSQFLQTGKDNSHMNIQLSRKWDVKLNSYTHNMNIHSKQVINTRDCSKCNAKMIALPISRKHWNTFGWRSAYAKISASCAWK